mmetsp:Transcript_15438/g.48523  ORF Transcript_15438/g.48523 Transcript_15438/m.48523 type:complete len:435 (+) Transcript_15438:361-1665(+)
MCKQKSQERTSVPGAAFRMAWSSHTPSKLTRLRARTPRLLRLLKSKSPAEQSDKVPLLPSLLLRLLSSSAAWPPPCSWESSTPTGCSGNAASGIALTQPVPASPGTGRPAPAGISGPSGNSCGPGTHAPTGGAVAVREIRLRGPGCRGPLPRSGEAWTAQSRRRGILSPCRPATALAARVPSTPASARLAASLAAASSAPRCGLPAPGDSSPLAQAAGDPGTAPAASSSCHSAALPAGNPGAACALLRTSGSFWLAAPARSAPPALRAGRWEAAGAPPGTSGNRWLAATAGSSPPAPSACRSGTAWWVWRLSAARARSGPRLPEDASGPWWATRALAQDSAEGGASGLSDRKLISDPCADDSCERCADVESVRRATPAPRGAGGACPGTTARPSLKSSPALASARLIPSSPSPASRLRGTTALDAWARIDDSLP